MSADDITKLPNPFENWHRLPTGHRVKPGTPLATGGHTEGSAITYWPKGAADWIKAYDNSLPVFTEYPIPLDADGPLDEYNHADRRAGGVRWQWSSGRWSGWPKGLNIRARFTTLDELDDVHGPVEIYPPYIETEDA